MFKKLGQSRIAQVFAGLYALEVLEIFLLSFIVIVAPRWLLPVALLTQTVQLIVATAFLALVWKSVARKFLARWRRYRCQNSDR